MVAWCVVPNCKGAKSAASGVVSFHHFPTNDADRCREWLRRINHPKYDEYTPPSRLKNLRVCGLHFRDEDFYKSMRARIMGTAEKKTLQTDANPSIFPQYSSAGEYEPSDEVPGPLEEEPSWTDENATAPPSSETVLTASTSTTAFLLETVSEVVSSGDTHSSNNGPESPAAAITEVIGFTDESDFSDEEENSMASENNSDSDWVPAKDRSEVENEITDSDSGTNEIDEEEDGTAVGLKLRQLCPECGKFFNIQKTHTCEYKFKHHSCNVCGKRFVTEHHLRSHSKIHKDGYKHKCMFCLKTFKTRPDKLAHEQSHPRVKKPYECPDCPEVFAKSRDRYKHLLAHRGPQKYICHTCNMEFPNNAALERHVLVHTGAKQFACELCQRSFSQASHLKSHMRVHTGEKPYQCPHCDKSFNHNVSLKSHIQRYHGGQVPGPGMKVQLEKPRRNESEAELDETNENNAALFICHICNLEFPYSGVLDRHVVVQTGGEKQFVCEACQHSFKWDDDDEQKKKDEEKKGRTKKGHKWYTGRPKGRPKRNAVIPSDVTYKLKRKSCDGDSASDSVDEEDEKRGSKKMKKTTRRSKGRSQIYGGEEEHSSDTDFEPAGGRTKRNVVLKTVMTEEGDEEGRCC